MRYLTGFHAIEELIKTGTAKGPLLVAKAGPRAKAIASLASGQGIPVNRVGAHELDRLAPDNRGIALLIGELPNEREELTVEDFIAGLDEESGEDGGTQGKKSFDRDLVLVLDGITDPHNYGAILRSCDQFGVGLVICPSRRSAKDTETVSKTSAGASAWVPVAVVPNLVRAVTLLKDAGYWIYGADMGGKNAEDIELAGRVALVMGSEGAGISRLLKETCDGTIGIPSYGKVDSLNVSVATGVLLYEATRQKRIGKKK